MNTPAISNVFSVQQPAASGRQDSPAADGAFNQILSREMNDTRPAAQPATPQSANERVPLASLVLRSGTRSFADCGVAG